MWLWDCVPRLHTSKYLFIPNAANKIAEKWTEMGEHSKPLCLKGCVHLCEYTERIIKCLKPIGRHDVNECNSRHTKTYSTNLISQLSSSNILFTQARKYLT